jgi:hypothetical protein
MAPLNSYFLGGSSSEQRLVQDLINEQLKMYGQDVVYMPRQLINEKTIIKEVLVSKFDDSFRIEAYISNFNGFGGQGDILSKFGVKTSDELTLIISKERYEDFITPFLLDDPDIKVATRPQEGDLIYLPIDNGLFEIKYVEGKVPFYQLNNLYVYELRCEIFRYEDELIDTSIDEVDRSVQDFGYIQTITMVKDTATTATATVSIASTQNNSVQYIDLINDGTGYLSTPTIQITKAPEGGIDATAVAIMTSKTERTGNSIDRILIVNPGIGYTQIPSVTIVGQSGSGAIATAVLASRTLGIVTITSGGSQYSSAPVVSISTAPAGGVNATAEAVLTVTGIVTAIRYTNAGAGYTVSPTITLTSPIGISTGDFEFNESVRGVSTGTTGYVKDWDADTRVLKVSIVGGNFANGELIVGAAATHKVYSINTFDEYDPYAENIQIEDEADDILDFSQKNPFGNY